MFNLAKLISKYFKVKFEPDLVHTSYHEFSKLVQSTKFTEFIDFTDFARVKSNFIGFEFLVRFNTLDTC